MVTKTILYMYILSSGDLNCNIVHDRRNINTRFHLKNTIYSIGLCGYWCLGDLSNYYITLNHQKRPMQRVEDLTYIVVSGGYTIRKERANLVNRIIITNYSVKLQDTL